jgi:hypothetical protein
MLYPLAFFLAYRRVRWIWAIYIQCLFTWKWEERHDRVDAVMKELDIHMNMMSDMMEASDKPTRDTLDLGIKVEVDMHTSKVIMNPIITEGGGGRSAEPGDQSEPGRTTGPEFTATTIQICSDCSSYVDVELVMM